MTYVGLRTREQVVEGDVPLYYFFEVVQKLVGRGVVVEMLDFLEEVFNDVVQLIGLLAFLTDIDGTRVVVGGV